jgi:preprotein translocase subunit SecE
MMKKSLEFGRSVQREIAKVTWPTQREIVMTTVMIFIMASVAAVFFFFIDWGVSKLIRLVLGMGA